MKKIAVSVLLLIAVIFSASKVYADNISESTARQLGSYYLSVMSGQGQAKPDKIHLIHTFQNPQQDIPAAFIYNIDGQGCVIISASDYFYPILGYSTEGLIDPLRMAPAMLHFFEGQCERICYCQDNEVSLFDTKEIASEWSALYLKTLTYNAPKATSWLIDDKWGQGDNYPPSYNKYCPHGLTSYGDSAYCYTGCVATAMSMILHYWKYPKVGKGSLGMSCYYTDDQEARQYYGYIDIPASERVYDYDNMPAQLTSMSTPAQINAVALLNFHCGVSVQMGYGFSGSGAQSTDVPSALKNKFKYANSCVFSYRQNSSDDSWMSKVRTEIEAGRPIYYSGYNTNTTGGRDGGGHAFVLDGLHPTDANKVHFNWGWDGTPNLWSDLRNNSLAAGGYNFNSYQAMVYGITPPADSLAGNNESIQVAENMSITPAYPNPASEKVTISCNNNTNEGQLMSIYSVDGRLIESVKIEKGASDITIDVTNYAKGLYIYRIGTKAQKFVVR